MDEQKSIGIYIAYMFNRTQQMFKWSNLPDTIPQRHLELFLQKHGNVCITKVNDKLYAFTGGMGGEPDPYYMPTLYTVANPALNFNKSLKIGEDCVVIPNDSFTLDGSAERAEKTTSYTFTVALEPGQEDLGYVLYVPEAE